MQRYSSKIRRFVQVYQTFTTKQSVARKELPVLSDCKLLDQQHFCRPEAFAKPVDRAPMAVRSQDSHQANLAVLSVLRQGTLVYSLSVCPACQGIVD
jgi:hypothetical protein